MIKMESTRSKQSKKNQESVRKLVRLLKVKMYILGDIESYAQLVDSGVFGPVPLSKPFLMPPTSPINAAIDSFLCLTSFVKSDSLNPTCTLLLT